VVYELSVLYLLFELPWTVMQGPIKDTRKLSESMVQIKMMKVRTGKLIYLYIHSALQRA
jgi:hypothetical protein